MKKNNQPIEKVVDDNPKGYLDIVSIFDTIQGEGPFAGRPAIFVRTAGCNLQCSGCDTDYTTGRRTLSPREIVQQIFRSYSGGNRNLVVLTGGEPFRQNIDPLVMSLLDLGMDVQIETNGTLFQPLRSEAFTVEGTVGSLSIVCSPKTPQINTSLSRMVHAYKYIIEADHISEADGLPLSVLGSAIQPYRPTTGNVPIYVQPMDSYDADKNKANVQACVDIAMRFGYRISLQLHKLLGLD